MLALSEAPFRNNCKLFRYGTLRGSDVLLLALAPRLHLTLLAARSQTFQKGQSDEEQL